MGKFGKFLSAIGSDWLARMSGPLTVPFTVAAFLLPSIRAKALFGGLAATAALLTSYRAWVKEHDRAEAEAAKNEGAPHMDIVDLNVVPHGHLGEGLTDLFFHVRLVLGEPSQVSVRNFTLEISNEATSTTFDEIDDVIEWSLVKPVGGFSRSPCVPLRKDLSKRGDPVQGCVHFRISNLSESVAQRCTLIFKVNCIHGTCYRYLPGSRVQPGAEGKGVMMKLPR
jgi:hypothetical protein